MVDPIGIKGAGGRDLPVSRTAPVAPTATATATATPSARASAPDSASLTGVAQTLSAAAPVDIDRVAKVKKAIADGRFPILPVTIADRMIALKLQWNQNAAA